MGFFGKLFGGGGEPEYPALDPASSGAQCIEKFRGQLEALIGKIKDRYEAIPHQNSVFVFLGHPPGMFGLAWFLDGDTNEHNLKTLMAKKGLSQRKMDKIVDKLREAYVAIENEPRYQTIVGERTMVVTPSAKLAESVYNIVHVVDE